MRTAIALMLLASPPALAADPLIEGGVEEAWEALRKLPPTWSWDFEMGSGYGEVPAWRRESQPGLLVGGRFAFGRHLDNPTHRLGGYFATSLDGPVPITFAWVIESGGGWDAVFGRFQIGTSVGYAISYNLKNELVGWDTSLTTGPALSLRLGYSDPWSRVGRRFHAFVEPKVRYIQGVVSPSAMVWVGSGVGR